MLPDRHREIKALLSSRLRCCLQGETRDARFCERARKKYKRARFYECALYHVPWLTYEMTIAPGISKPTKSPS